MGDITLKVKELMEERGMSVSDLQYDLRVTRPTAARLAESEGTGMSFSLLGRLCELFEVSPEKILHHTFLKRRKK